MEKIILPLKTKLGSTPYSVIYLPTNIRSHFPDYGKKFVLQTDVGDILTHVTSKSDAMPNGCYITTGLRTWFRKRNFTEKDILEIEIVEPLKKYYLRKISN